MSTPYRKPRTVWILAALLGLLLLANLVHAGTGRAARTPAAKQAWQYRYLVWMPAHWQRLAACESGSDPPNWKRSAGYEGAFGFLPSSWRAFKYNGYPYSAADATPFQQFQVARRIAAHYHSIAGSWGCWRGPEHAWVRGGLSERGTWR